MITTMDNEWDIMPAGRVKFTHRTGAVCKFSLDIKNSTFSGLFKNGNRIGIIRIGWNWDGGIFEESGPGASAAIKFLRSGVSSGNSVFQRLPEGSIYSTYNLFDPEVNTLVSHRNGILWAGMEKFHGVFKTKQGSKHNFVTGLSDMAR